MFRYRTEIVVPPDRYVWIKLPDSAPEGPAIVSVIFPPEPAGTEDTRLAEREAVPARADGRAIEDGDRDDIEWWEEFEESPETD